MIESNHTLIEGEVKMEAPYNITLLYYEDQREIHKLYKQGRTMTSLGKQYNVSRDTIRRAIRNIDFEIEQAKNSLKDAPEATQKPKFERNENQGGYHAENENKPSIKLSWIMGEDFVNIVSKTHNLNIVVDESHKNFTSICLLLSEGKYEQALKSYDLGLELIELSGGLITIKNNIVSYDGREVPTKIAVLILDKVKEYRKCGNDATVLIRFFSRLLGNPSQSAVMRLYDFMRYNNIKIANDGRLITWKAVRLDYKDIYSNTVSNRVGSIIEMERSDVDDDHDHHCSNGYHVGSLEYVRNYGGNNKRYIACLVDPADIVSVPTDHDGQKCRTCKYYCALEVDGADLTESMSRETIDKVVKTINEQLEEGDING